MQIHQLKVNKKKSRKRVGRGGKKGTYCGTGMNGQKSRSGFSRRATFEGGQSTLTEHTKKKRGFKSVAKGSQVVSLEKIDAKFKEGEVVTIESLKINKLIKDVKIPVKILSDGELSKKIVFEKVLVSKSAEKKIKEVGGEVK